MKKALIAFMALGLVAALSYTFVSPAQAGDKEHHPHIRQALKELRECRTELKEADHDFGGHRAEALKSVDEAIVQLEQALKFDKK